MSLLDQYLRQLSWGRMRWSVGAVASTGNALIPAVSTAKARTVLSLEKL